MRQLRSTSRNSRGCGRIVTIGKGNTTSGGVPSECSYRIVSTKPVRSTMLSLRRHPRLSAMRMATNCHRWNHVHEAVELAGMAVKDVRNGATAGKAWRRERGRRNQQSGSHYNHLSSSHWLGKGREGWNSLDDNLGNLMATLASVCSGQSSSTLLHGQQL